MNSKVNMDLNRFMQKGADRILKTAGRFYLSSKEGRAFLADILPQIRKSALLRNQNEKSGLHVPPFLIASIASQCNLHCAGCYAQTDGGACCGGGASDVTPDLSASEWTRIFEDASALGISFILLAGGEPLLRRDIIEAAAKFSNVIFPIFTNSTMMDDSYLALFIQNRHLVPILSLEGNAELTDARRGSGVYAQLEAVMAQLLKRRILFGVSITVTKENKEDVVAAPFLSALRSKGCGTVIFVEYVPVEENTEYLVLDEADLTALEQRTYQLKKQLDDMIILSFPGDEASMGGCLASGRGFFHINPKGGAEPCPFAPYPKYNLRETPMHQILRSPYFDALRSIAAQADVHTGGCVLFKQKSEVQALLYRELESSLIQ